MSGLGVEIQEWLLSLVLALVLSSLYVMLSPDEETENQMTRNLRRGKTKGSIFLRVFGGLIRVSGQLISLIPMQANRKRLTKKLLLAGNPGGLSADEFHATRVIAIIFLGAAGSFIDAEIDSSPFLFLGLSVLGLLYPDIWLNGKIDKRRRAIFRNLPDVLDILRLAIEAGLDLASALSVVVERGQPGPLLDELEMVEREMSLGRTRKDALKNFADRLGMAEISAFVLAIIQADQLGASIGPVLRSQSEMARNKRWQLAEALVNKMPTKMLGPLVLFIFPSSFIILFTPLLIQWKSSK